MHLSHTNEFMVCGPSSAITIVPIEIKYFTSPFPNLNFFGIYKKLAFMFTYSLEVESNVTSSAITIVPIEIK